MKPLSTDPSKASGLQPLRIPAVTSGAEADAVEAVSFDRVLVEVPGWGDRRLARYIAEATRVGREQGLAEGYAAGWAQGRRAAAEREQAERQAMAEREEAARRQLVARAQALLAALAQTGRTLAEQVTPAWEELMDALIEGALGIAAAGLGRELAGVDAEVLEAARTALRLLPGDEVVTLHVHPGDLDLLTDGGSETAGEAAGIPDGLRVVPDPGVAAGSVVARTPLHSLPVDLAAAVRTAQEVLQR